MPRQIAGQRAAAGTALQVDDRIGLRIVIGLILPGAAWLLGHEPRGALILGKPLSALATEALILLAFSAVLLPLGLWLGQSGLERAVLVGSWLIVPIVELLNSAVETNVDRVGLERHELSGRAKDIASAAVLLAISVAILTWAVILLPRLIAA